MRISDWSSDWCSSDLCRRHDKLRDFRLILIPEGIGYRLNRRGKALDSQEIVDLDRASIDEFDLSRWGFVVTCRFTLNWEPIRVGCHRSEEHTSELQSLMRISYAVFCLKKKT